MKKLFVVDSICNGKITVSPPCFDSAKNDETPPSTTNQGKKRRIEALNPEHLQITEGCCVLVRFPQNFEVARGIAALVLPVAAAFLGLLGSPFLANKIQRELTEFFKAFCASGCFLIAAAIVFLLSRRHHPPVYPRIIATCRNIDASHIDKTII